MPEAPRQTKSAKRLFVPVTRESLPQVGDKYPFLYLEHGRLEIDDSSLKWTDANASVIRLPAAILASIFLGPGTSVTHEAIKVAAMTNCLLCWVGEDALTFYAHGDTPTADTRNIKRQAMLSSDPDLRLRVARALCRERFPDADLENRSLKELMGMEGIRVKCRYEQLAQRYGVGWKGRKYVPGRFELGDMTNRLLSALNSLLYALITACVHSMGYTPLLGFIHSGSPLPLVYDFADLYKSETSMDLAFALSLSLAGEYNKYAVADAFRIRVQEMDLLKRIVTDLDNFLGEANAGRYSK